MTEKIKLTQEQADFIERGFEAGMEAEEMINRFASAGLFVKQPSHKLHGLCVADLAKALLIGYEIEPRLKVGDWAVRKKGRRIIKKPTDREGIAFQIEEIGIGVLGSDGNNHAIGALRHATPEEIAEEKERRKWAEIEEGDILRKIPMAHEVAIYEGDADDESILVKNDSGQRLWRKSQVELYAKKVGGK